MIPFVITGGITTSLSYLFKDTLQLETAASFFGEIGSMGMMLMWPAVSTGIAFSLAGNKALVAGALAGFLANQMNTAFLGATIGAFIAGYFVLFLKTKVNFPKSLIVVKDLMLTPLLSSILMVFFVSQLIGKPLAFFNTMILNVLEQMSQQNGVLLGALIGLMMIIDLAGPIGKSAYFFGVATLDGLQSGETSLVMAAVMVAGMVPPLSLALAMQLVQDKFPQEDVESSAILWVLGATFVTESVISYTVKDIKHILPGFLAGTILSGALSMYFKCGISLPHGGVFAMMIPGAINKLFYYVAALLAGVAMSTILIVVAKKGRIKIEKI